MGLFNVSNFTQTRYILLRLSIPWIRISSYHWLFSRKSTVRKRKFDSATFYFFWKMPPHSPSITTPCRRRINCSPAGNRSLPSGTCDGPQLTSFFLSTLTDSVVSFTMKPWAHSDLFLSTLLLRCGLQTSTVTQELVKNAKSQVHFRLIESKFGL